MGRVANDDVFLLHDAFPDVASDLVGFRPVPEAVGPHDLVELLQLAQAGHVGAQIGSVLDPGPESAGPGEARVGGQQLPDELGLRRPARQGGPEEAFVQGEKAFGPGAAAANRDDPRRDGERRYPLRLGRRDFVVRLVQNGAGLVHGRPLPKEPLGGILPRLVGGSRRRRAGLPALVVKKRVVVGGRDFPKRLPGKARQHVKPDGVRGVAQDFVVLVAFAVKVRLHNGRGGDVPPQPGGPGRNVVIGVFRKVFLVRAFHRLPPEFGIKNSKHGNMLSIFLKQVF
jgi:hypothetical protein